MNPNLYRNKPGNVRLREMASALSVEYMNSNAKIRLLLQRRVMEDLKSEGRVFWRQNEDKTWAVVTPKEVKERIEYALLVTYVSPRPERHVERARFTSHPFA